VELLPPCKKLVVPVFIRAVKQEVAYFTLSDIAVSIEGYK